MSGVGVSSGPGVVPAPPPSSLYDVTGTYSITSNIPLFKPENV